MYHQKMRSSESGNVFFYIFLGVALFGALTYAVSQSGRGSVDSLTREQSRLHATEIIDFSDAVSKAVGMMRLRGVTLSQLRFAHANLPIPDYGDPDTIDAASLVFNADGGGVVYTPPARETLTTPGQPWMFLTRNQIDGMGTTCPAWNCTEVVMAAANMRDDVCVAINTLAGINNSSTIPVHSQFITSDKFKGVINGTPVIIGDEAGSAVLSGQSYGCLKSNANGINYFYRVLWQQ